MKPMTLKQFAKYFDHTCLKAFAQRSDFETLCEEAKKYGFMMVAINSVPVALCKELLADSDVHVGAAISFPLGQTTIETKVFETKKSIEDGCDEIDYVINVGKAKDGDWDYIRKEMMEIVAACREGGVLSKVIFETCYLTDDEIMKIAQIAKEVKPDFIKTSTGFGTAGATVKHVKLMKSVVGDSIKVKASGGIKTLDLCLELISAGAERIGASSCVALVEEYSQKYL